MASIENMDDWNNITDEDFIEADQPNTIMVKNFKSIIADKCMHNENYTNKVIMDSPALTICNNLILPRVDILDYNNPDAIADVNISLNFGNEKMKFETNAIILDPDKLRSYPHDFTFECIQDQTDEDIGYLVNGVNVGATPDWIIKIETDDKRHDLFVFEFTTRASDDSLEFAYEEKKEKYIDTLRDMLKYHKDTICNIHFFIICVGPTTVYHNLTGLINDYDVITEMSDVLVYRYKISKLIYERIKTLKNYSDRDIGNLSTETYKLEFKVLPRFTIENGDGPFTIENYETVCLGEYSKGRVDLALNYCGQQCKNDFINDVKKHKLQRSLKTKLHDIIKSIKSVEHWEINEDIGFIEPEATEGWNSYMEDVMKKNPKGFKGHDKSVVNIPFFLPKRSGGNMTISLKKCSLFANSIMTDGDVVLDLWKSTQEYIRRPDFHTNQSALSDLNEDEVGKLLEDNSTITSDELVLNIDKLNYTSGSTPNEMRRFFNRIIADASDKIALAKFGIKAKSLRFDSEIKEHVKKRKMFFHPESTNVSDVDDFINEFDILQPTNIMDNLSQRLPNNLFHIASSVHKAEDDSVDHNRHLTFIKTTLLYSYIKFVSDLALELTISLRQNCRENEYIIKKLKDWDVYILIKPTNLTSHLFYSLLVFKKDVESSFLLGKVFRNFNEGNDVYWTDFVSVQEHKLINWNLTESKFISTISFWMEHYKIDTSRTIDQEIRNTSDYKQCCQMIKLSLLVHLSDKREVEELMTLTRYIGLESLKVWPYNKEPHKLFHKFPTNIKSRLTVWVSKRIKQYCSLILLQDGSPVSLADEDESVTSSHYYQKLDWRNLLNPYTLKPCKNPSEMVNIFYLGYYCNKDDIYEDNKVSSLYSKIVGKEEELTDEVFERIGKVNKDPKNGSNHEYNMDLIKRAVHYVKENLLVDLRGKGWQESFEDNLLVKLSLTNLEDIFFTLKASSNYGPDLYEFTPGFAYSRSKVIIECSKLINGSKTKVIDILNECMDKVKLEGDNSLNVCVFPKNQHQGAREIYVLPFASRVLQWFIEQLGRAVCGLFASETMTHPNSKDQIPEKHNKIANNLFKKNSSSKVLFNMNASCDAAKWSQYHFSHKFAVMLTNFFSKKWHGLIWSVLELWMRKRVMILPSLLKLFDRFEDFKCYDETIQKMFDGNKGSEDIRWAPRGKTYVELKSGMMQGILHYTSSAFHTIINEYYKRIVTRFIKKRVKCDVVMEVMQSSDDSGVLLSVIADKESKRLLPYLMHYALQFKKYIGLLVGIVESEKSIKGTPNFYEFNSQFHMGPAHYEAFLKHLITAFLISEGESLTKRQEEMYSLLTMFIEKGGTNFVARTISYSQALLYYRMMGSTVTDRFILFSQLITRIPDPSLGFYLVDHPLAVGIPGFSYNLWKMMSFSIINRYYKRKFFRIIKKKKDIMDTMSTKDSLNENDYIGEVSQSGSISKNLRVFFGKRTKWQRMVDKMNLPIDWVEQIESDPSILLRSSENENDLRLKIAMKVHSPGVALSLSTGKEITRILSSAVYVLSSEVFSDVLELNLESVTVFHSLFHYHKDALIKDDAESELLTKEEERTLFPFVDGYHRVSNDLNIMNNSIMKLKNRVYSRKITEVDVFDMNMSGLIKPLDIIKWVWFGNDNRVKKDNISRNAAIERFELMKRIMPWLKNDIKETMLLSPFITTREMIQWFSRYTGKSRIVRLIASTVLSRSGRASFINMVKYNYRDSYFIVPTTLEDVNIELEHRYESQSNLIMNDMHSVVTVCTYPFLIKNSSYSIVDKESVINRILSYSPISDFFHDSLIRNRKNTLCLISKFLKAKRLEIESNNWKSIESKERFSLLMNEFQEILLRHRGGVCGGFSKPQIRNRDGMYVGPGIWTGVVDKVRVNIFIYSDPNGKEKDVFVQYIEVDKIVDKRSFEISLNRIIQEMGISYMNENDCFLMTQLTNDAIRNGDISLNRKYYGNLKNGKITIGGFNMMEFHSIPIYRVDKIPLHFENFENYQFELHEDRTLRVVSETFGRRITILSYTINQNDFHEDIRPSVVPQHILSEISKYPLLRLYVLNIPGNIQDMNKVISFVVKRNIIDGRLRDNISKEDSKFRRVLKKLFNREKIYFPSNPTTSMSNILSGNNDQAIVEDERALKFGDENDNNKKVVRFLSDEANEYGKHKPNIDLYNLKDISLLGVTDDQMKSVVDELETDDFEFHFEDEEEETIIEDNLSISSSRASLHSGESSFDNSFGMEGYDEDAWQTAQNILSLMDIYTSTKKFREIILTKNRFFDHWIEGLIDDFGKDALRMCLTNHILTIRNDDLNNFHIFVNMTEAVTQVTIQENVMASGQLADLNVIDLV
jgi:hypothetical protein